MADVIEQLLSRLHHPTLAAIDMKLDRMHRLLSMLGNPQKKLPPVIHVAGTNGKGSLIAYLRAIFEAAEKSVHVYTSPHLGEFRERIVLSGNMIENAQLTQIAQYVSRVLTQQPATFFEATTAMAFLAFAQKKADVLLLEVGMGGRLDCTNVVDKPALSAITPVSFDHMDFLGDTLAKIAAEKAGILKAGVPCVVGRQEPEALAVIEAQAGALGAPLIPFSARGLALCPSLAGAHQLDNAATAVSCIDALPQFGITDEQILQGIASAKWPARLQTLSFGPLRKILPGGMRLVLDGGHNAQGGEVLARWLSAQNLPVYAICGMVGSKDAKAYMQAIAPQVKKLWAVAIPGEKESKSAREVALAATSVGIDAAEAASVEAAAQEIAKIAPQSALVVVAGSLYLAGHILKTHG